MCRYLYSYITMLPTYNLHTLQKGKKCIQNSTLAGYFILIVYCYMTSLYNKSTFNSDENMGSTIHRVRTAH